MFIRDGELFSSAGSSAAIDLGLLLVEEGLGPEVSRGADHRPQTLAHRSAVHPESSGRDFSVTAPAKIAAMSVRNFTRVFTRDNGIIGFVA